MHSNRLAVPYRIAVVFVAAGLPGWIHASTLTWDVTSGDGSATTDGAGSWTTGAGNWNDGVTDATWNNATPDSAVFGSNNPAGSYAVSLGGPITTGGLTFNAGTTYTVTGNTLTLSGTPTISVASSTTANIGSILGGTGFNKTGTGTLVLNGASVNTYSGSVTVSNGTLALGAGAGDGAIRGNVTIASGSTLRFDAVNRMINSSIVTIQSGGTFNRNGSGDVIGGIADSGALIGAGTLTFDHAAGVTSTFSGPITGGNINVRGANGTGGAKQVLTGTITVGGIAVQRPDTAGDISWLELGGSGTTTLSGNMEVGITNGGTNNGTARLDITGSHTLTAGGFYMGQTASQGGVANQSGGTVNVGSRLQIGHYPSETSTYTLSSGVINITAANPGSTPSAGTEQNGGIYLGVDGTGELIQSGGTINTKFVVLDNRGATAGTDTYTMTGGTLALQGSHGFILRNAGSSTVNLGGGTIRAETTLPFSSAANLSGTGGSTTIDASGSNVITFSGALSGAGGLIKTGTGTSILTADNSYVGTTVINAGSGTFRVAQGGATGSLGTGDVSIGSGSTLTFRRNNLLAVPNDISGAGTVRIGLAGAGGPVTGQIIDFTGDNSGLTGNMVIHEGGARIHDANGLGTGTKTVNIVDDNGSNKGQPNLRLSSVSGFTLPSTISLVTSNGGTTSAAGTIVNEAGNNAIDGSISLIGGGGDSRIASTGGNLTLNGAITSNFSGGRILFLAGASTGVINGVLQNGSGSLTLRKEGTGTWTLGNAANTYTGKTQLGVGGAAGMVLVNTGSENSLGAAPGSYVADQLSLNGGGLGITGSSLTLNDANRGITIGASGGTFSADTGLTLTVANTINGSSGQLNKAGAGTFNLTAGTHALGSINVTAGTFTQSGGTVNTPSGTVGGSGTYRLAGGKLRLDALNLSGGFDWTGGTLTHYTTGTSIAMAADNSSVGFQEVGVGRTATVTGDLSSGAGAVLALHGSPTLYESLGIRFNNFSIIGALALAGVGDVLELELNPYLLRPFSSQGELSIEYGSLPLVTWTGAYDGNTFDSVTGIGNDGRGFALSTFGVVDGSALDINTYFLEYDAAAQTLWFHYKVNGYVPEPDTFALLALSVIGLRTARTLGERRRRMG